MKFHFEFEIKKFSPPLTHRSKLLLIGSCFTENMGEKLDRYKFRVLQNPNGILFNPVSVAEAITSYIDRTQYNEADIFEWNEGWHSWKYHSRFSTLTKEAALSGMNAAIAEAHTYLKEADCVLITLGSAWVYRLTEKAVGSTAGSVAANNHKAPADWFTRKLLTPEEILQMLDNLIHRLFLFRPGIRIIFTISPVRHLREGVVENNRSKAALIQAVHHLVDKFEGLYYFPAYELVIDDLRDYRFYAEDLVHPNYAATEYVWEKFVGACMDEPTKALIQELHTIYLAFRHKAFNPSSEAHKKFRRSYHSKALALKEQYPFLDLEREIEYFAA